jgi:signal transduction histidine kinase
MEKIFAPFYTTKPEGMGIGLAICRSIIEFHQGRLWVTPRREGGTDSSISPYHRRRGPRSADE